MPVCHFHGSVECANSARHRRPMSACGGHPLWMVWLRQGFASLVRQGQKMHSVPCAISGIFRSIVGQGAYFPVHFLEEACGMRRGVQDQHPRGGFRHAGETMDRSSGRVHEVAGADQGHLVANRESHLSIGDVEASSQSWWCGGGPGSVAAALPSSRMRPGSGGLRRGTEPVCQALAGANFPRGGQSGVACSSESPVKLKLSARNNYVIHYDI